VTPLVRLRGVGFRYPGGTEALRDLDLEIAGRPAGARLRGVGVVGPNGAGKTTLLAALVGLVPVSGSIEVLGESDLVAARRRVGFLFQEPEDQLLMPTIGEDVALGPRARGLEEGEVERRVARALETVGLEARAGAAPRELSGGERRLAALAGLFAAGPELLLLDEPTAHLDARGRRRIIETLRGFPGAALIATHDLALVGELAEETVLLAGGRALAFGPTREVLGDEARLRSQGLLD
jgi:cobalt/nickel transport system ATP-binding protein